MLSSGADISGMTVTLCLRSTEVCCWMSKVRMLSTSSPKKSMRKGYSEA